MSSHPAVATAASPSASTAVTAVASTAPTKSGEANTSPTALQASAFWRALREHDMHALEQAIDATNVNLPKPDAERREKRDTPLIVAAKDHRTTAAAIVEILLRYGGDTTAQDSYYRTPLMHAALIGNERIVELLCRSPATRTIVNDIDQAEKTALHYAAGRRPSGGGNPSVFNVRLLLRLGADPNGCVPPTMPALKVRGTPLTIALEAPNVTLLHHLLSLLIACGAYSYKALLDYCSRREDPEFQAAVTALLQSAGVVDEPQFRVASLTVLSYRYINRERHRYTPAASQLPFEMQACLLWSDSALEATRGVIPS